GASRDEYLRRVVIGFVRRGAVIKRDISAYFYYQLTVRANFREKLRIALSSWDEHKNYSSPRTSRRPPGHHHAPQENACGRIIGQPLPAQWQLAGLESWRDDGRVVGLYPLRGRPPTLSRRAVGQSPSAYPQSVPRPTGQITRPDR